MPPNLPLVTVGMPSYNKGPYIGEAIESMLAQSYANFELLISDDGSTDDSAAVCRAYAERDPRVRFVSQATNLGMIDNFDYVLNHARGELFMWFSADDRVDPKWLETCVAALGDEAAIGFGRLASMTAEGAPLLTFVPFPITGPQWRRIVRLYWKIIPECNLLHGVTRTERVRARGGLAFYRFAGQTFDFLYVFESALDGALLNGEGAWIHKRDSPNNGLRQRESASALLRNALLPGEPIRRVLLLHRARLSLGYKLLLALMFVPRCLFELAGWYAKGFGVVARRLRRRAA